MIQFEPPYRGMDKATNFPVVVHGVLVVSNHLEAIIVDFEGNLLGVDIETISVDIRYDRAKRDFVDIDDPSSEQRD